MWAIYSAVRSRHCVLHLLSSNSRRELRLESQEARMSPNELTSFILFHKWPLIQPPSSPILRIFTFIIISIALKGDLASPQQALFSLGSRSDHTVCRAWHAKKWVWHKVRSLKRNGEIKLHKQHWEWKSSPAKKWNLGYSKRHQKLGSSWKKNHLNS